MSKSTTALKAPQESRTPSQPVRPAKMQPRPPSARLQGPNRGRHSKTPSSGQIAESVGRLILARGLQQKEVARRLRLQPSNLNLFLRGHKDVRGELLLKLLAHLGIDVRSEIERATLQASRVQAAVEISPIEAIESVYHLLRPVDRMALLEFVLGMAKLQIGDGAAAPVARLKTELVSTRARL